MNAAGFFLRCVPQDNGCLLWMGARMPHGYGNVRRSGGTYTGAHRYAFELYRGRPPAPGMDVCHTCDVRNCVADAHLFEGTRSDNMQDAKRKGRTSPPPRHRVTRAIALRGWDTRRARAAA